MRLGFVSDLHYDVNESILKGKETVNSMVKDTREYINKEGLDYLFISGDIMNGLKKVQEVVRELDKGKTEVYYVLGNHDFWGSNRDAWYDLEKIRKDEKCLVNKSLDLGNGVEIVGMFSWYDSSFETLGKDEDYYDLVKYKWVDIYNVNWEGTNEQTTFEMIKRGVETLERVSKDKSIILLNHFVPNKDYIIHSDDDNWNFGNAFMGTERLNEMVKRDERIDLMTFGHTHKRFGLRQNYGINYLSNPLGYVNEWDGEDFKNELKEVIKTVKI